MVEKLAVVVLATACVTGCGKIAAGLAKGAAHEADNVATTAGRSAASEEANVALSAAAHSADDMAPGPKAADEAAPGTPVTNFMIDRAQDVVEELGTNGLQEALSSDESDDKP